MSNERDLDGVYDLSGRISNLTIEPGSAIFFFDEDSDVPPALEDDMTVLLLSPMFQAIEGTIVKGGTQRALLALSSGQRWIIEPNTRKGYRSGLESVDAGENWIVWKAAPRA